MPSYTKLTLADGVTVRLDQVRRDDGANVLTGMLPGRDGEPAPVEGFDDPDGLAYQGWLKDGGKPGEPVSATRPREATGYALVMALTDDQRGLYGSAKPWDQRRLSLRGSDHIPEDNPLVARVAAVLKTDPKAWFDRALGAGA